jgi:hypothetical protein
VSPILVRPVREQLEHDRVIRLLQAKYRRNFDVGMNPGAEQNASVGNGASAVHPDLILTSPERGRRVQAIVEVETSESVNHLEALAEWAHFATLRATFYLYVPSGMVEVARRLCDDNRIVVGEVWSYHTVGDEVRFTLVHRNREATQPARPRPGATPRRKAAVAPKRSTRSIKTSSRPAAKKSAARPAARRAQKRR